MQNLEKLKIKKATSINAKSIYRIRRAGWISGYGEILGKDNIDEFFNKQINNQDTVKNLKDYLDNENHNCYVASINNKNIGLFWFEDNDKKTSDMCYIYGLYILPEYQRIGLGSYIWEYMKNILKQKGYKSMCLDTPKGNMKAENFYKKHNGIITKQFNEPMMTDDNTDMLEFTFDL